MTNYKTIGYKIIGAPVNIAPLVSFRIIFGCMMLASTLRFIYRGWIESLYLQPTFHFKYFGFHWVPAPSPWLLYSIFAVLVLACLGILLGYFYRVSAALFFLLFTYVELIDISYYLNHYYFISLVALIMVFLPAHKSFSLDANRKPSIHQSQTPAWTINLIKLQLGIVYFYAGVAKLNADWLLHAMPLKIWLPGKSYYPIIGPLLEEEWVAFAFSWFGAAYDLLIPFALLFRKTRGVAYVAVVVFHLVTGSLFQIGMFPYIMILATLVFFSEGFHEKLLHFLGRSKKQYTPWMSFETKPLLRPVLYAFIVFQLAFPWRYLAYPGDLFWTEEGYRFSWRVMLMEKAGYASFIVKDKEKGIAVHVPNYEYLTPFQEKQMATQPDLMLQYAAFLGQEYRNKGIENPAVFVESYVSLNGYSSRPYIDPTIDLLTLEDGFAHKKWILPFNKISK